MNGTDIAVIVIVGINLIAVLGILIYRKIKRKGGCCGCCESCGYCKDCGRREKK